MNIEAIRKRIEGLNKGGFITVYTERDLEVKKRGSLNGKICRKASVLQLRVGHSYYNQKATIEAHESGEREIWGLPSWASVIDEHFIQSTSGKILLRGQPSGNPAKSSFTVNGETVEFDSIASELTAKEQPKSEKSDWLYINIDNILAINS